MKKIILTAVFILFGLSANADANTDFAKRVGGYFYTSLAPHGTWIEIGFGTPVWRPTMIRKSWAPYRQGQWIYTDYGWYWDSYEDFGYITYHYGRWYYDEYYGWIWIPDYEWAPAWVDWRYDDDYIGWAPLSPYALFDISIGIYYNYDYYVSYNHWNYVKYNHFCDHNVYNYYVAPKYKHRVHNRTKMRTNYSYYDGRVRNDGVDFDRIRERSGRNIERRDIVSVNDPNDLSREKIRKTRDKEIRTYFANPDDISRDGLRDVKVERKERKSTLEISKVELGRDRNLDRTKETKKDDTREVIRNDREKNNTDLNKREKTKDTRKETNNDVTRKKVEDDRKLQEKRETEKRNSEIEKRNNDQIKRNEENKRNDELRKSEEKNRIEQNKRNEQIEIQKRQDKEVQKRNEVTIQKREEKKSNTDVFNQNERKVEQKKETQKVEQRNQNNNRNTEVKRNDSNNRTNNGNTKTSDNEKRNKSR